MASLMTRLQGGPHPVIAARDETTAALVDSLRRGFVLLRFEHTHGGTELGIALDPSACQPEPRTLTQADAQIHVVGTLSLDGQAVQCIADLDLRTRRGWGHVVLRKL